VALALRQVAIRLEALVVLLVAVERGQRGDGHRLAAWAAPGSCRRLLCTQTLGYQPLPESCAYSISMDPSINLPFGSKIKSFLELIECASAFLDVHEVHLLPVATPAGWRLRCFCRTGGQTWSSVVQSPTWMKLPMTHCTIARRGVRASGLRGVLPERRGVRVARWRLLQRWSPGGMSWRRRSLWR
jgi:hypothetical protein